MNKYNINIEDLRSELKEAAATEEFPQRHIKIVLVITKALEDLRVHPILVGGGAVEFYTMGAYTTGDIDLVAPSGKDIDERLKALGFEKRGKNRVNEGLNIFLEFPSSTLGSDADYNELDIGEGKVRIISIEDLVVDRLNAFKWWGSTVDGINALLLLNSSVVDIDREELETKVESHDLMDAYEGIMDLWERVRQGKLDMDKATESIEKLGRNFPGG